MQTSAVLNGDRANNGQHQEVIEVQILPQVNTNYQTFILFLLLFKWDSKKNKKKKMYKNGPAVLFIFFLSWDLIDHSWPAMSACKQKKKTKPRAIQNVNENLFPRRFLLFDVRFYTQ